MSDNVLFTGSEIVNIFSDLGVSHVVWLPDSTMGLWEEALESAAAIQLLRVCREGEAWPLAAGLHLGGQSPVVLMQSTGFFESGDAMRNVLFDLRMPIFAVVGARNWIVESSRDSARKYIDPILHAWGIDYQLIETVEDKGKLADHYRKTREQNLFGISVLAEGRG